jgi:hypothetical protein
MIFCILSICTGTFVFLLLVLEGEDVLGLLVFIIGAIICVISFSKGKLLVDKQDSRRG